MTKYFYLNNGEKVGPFNKEELSKQNISRNTKVWYYGLEKWTEIQNIKKLDDITNSIPPEISNKNNKEDSKKTYQKLKNKKKLDPPVNKIKTNTKWIVSVIGIMVIVVIIYLFSQNDKNSFEYENISKNSYESNEDFQTYIDKFYRDLEFYGIYPKKPNKIIIKFSKLDKIDNTTHIHGISYGYENDNEIEIYINPSSWKLFNKAKRYYLMYHELCHDILNLDDLELLPENEGKLMYPSIASYEDINMDDFIESYHTLFEEYSENNYQLNSFVIPNEPTYEEKIFFTEDDLPF